MELVKIKGITGDVFGSGGFETGTASVAVNAALEEEGVDHHTSGGDKRKQNAQNKQKFYFSHDYCT